MKKIKEFLLTDVAILNKYFLVIFIIILLSFVGYESYSLFSFATTSTDNIKMVFNPLPKCSFTGPSISQIGTGEISVYELSCTSLVTLNDVTLTSTNFNIIGDISISSIEKATITSGYKYTITVAGGTTDSLASIQLKANTITDTNGNSNSTIVSSSNVSVVTFPSEPEKRMLYIKCIMEEQQTQP